MNIIRSLEPALIEFLEEKVVLLSGPRQVGKTYLSKKLSKQLQYFNFDLSEDREILRSKSWLRNGSLVIFDEIHKMKKWKQWVKGIYDSEWPKNHYLITGSAQLDTIKRAGDSLAGRHYSLRLLPLSLKEIDPKGSKKILEEMLTLGSFPEPFLKGSERKAALWRKSHLDIIIRQDIIQLENIREIINLELLVSALRRRVGQQIVYQNLADELSVSIHTIKKWIQILESFYIIFIVYPYVKNVLDAVKKEPKIYFYDVGQVQSDLGFKIENLVALHLLKRNHFLEDTEGYTCRLCYIRDKKKREVDFAVVTNNKLSHLIEVKQSEESFNKNLDYFCRRLNPEHGLHIVFNINRESDYQSYKVRDLTKFLLSLET